MKGLTLLDGETFVKIDDFPDYYVSNCGRVYSEKRCRCIGSPNTKNGHLMVYLSNGKRTKNRYIYDLVTEYFDKPKPDERGIKINFIDGNVENNSIENLEWIHPQESEQRKERRRRSTKKEVEEFCRWYIYKREELMNLPDDKVAAKFEEETKIKIHPTTVRNNRDKWYIENETDRLCKIPDEALDDVEKILRK